MNSVLITKVLIPFFLQQYKSTVVLLKYCSYAVGELQVGEPGQVLGDSTVFSTYISLLRLVFSSITNTSVKLWSCLQTNFLHLTLFCLLKQGGYISD